MKHGFKVMDSDLHTMEPDGLWERYLDEPFKRFAPKFVRREDNGVWLFGPLSRGAKPINCARQRELRRSEAGHEVAPPDPAGILHRFQDAVRSGETAADPL